MTVTHHDLCFGCGQANLFGLQIELERSGEGEVAGRFFVKQDHQGPPGLAHGGIIATALDEAMALLVHAEGIHALTRRLELELLGPVPIGSFVHISARVDRRENGRVWLRAELRAGEGPGGRPQAVALGEFVAVG